MDDVTDISFSIWRERYTHPEGDIKMEMMKLVYCAGRKMRNHGVE